MSIESEYDAKFINELVGIVVGGLDGYKRPTFSLNENTDPTVLAIKKDAIHDGLEVFVVLPSFDKILVPYNPNRLNVHLGVNSDGYYIVNKFRLG